MQGLNQILEFHRLTRLAPFALPFSILVFDPPAGKLKICQPTHRSLRGFQYTSPVNQMIDPDMPLSFHEGNYKSQNHGESTQ